MSHWTYGIIDRLSSRSLIFIDADDSDEDESLNGNKISRGSMLKAPSTHELSASGIQSNFVSEGSHKTPETHMVNTPPRSTASPCPNESCRREFHYPYRLAQSRRPSHESTINGDVTPLLTSKFRIVRTKVDSPKKPTRKVSFAQACDPFSACEDSTPSSVHNKKRTQVSSDSLLFLPPPSPRKASEKRPSKYKSRSCSPRKSHKSPSR